MTAPKYRRCTARSRDAPYAASSANSSPVAIGSVAAGCNSASLGSSAVGEPWLELAGLSAGVGFAPHGSPLFDARLSELVGGFARFRSASLASRVVDEC